MLIPSSSSQDQVQFQKEYWICFCAMEMNRREWNQSCQAGNLKARPLPDLQLECAVVGRVIARPSVTLFKDYYTEQNTPQAVQAQTSMLIISQDSTTNRTVSVSGGEATVIFTVQRNGHTRGHWILVLAKAIARSWTNLTNQQRTSLCTQLGWGIFAEIHWLGSKIRLNQKSIARYAAANYIIKTWIPEIYWLRRK